MKKALISPNEACEAGYRVAEVHDTGFDVASPLFWIEVLDSVLPENFWFDPIEKVLKPVPEPLPVTQPLSQGAQTL